MVSGQRGKQRSNGGGAPAMNNFMADERNSPLKDETDGSRVPQPYFHKHEMDIESGYPSESDAQATSLNKHGRPKETYDPLNESKISFAPLLKVRA